jgi:hypothetical protein
MVEPLSMKAVQAARMSQLLAKCLDVGFGTLWRVREDFWLENLPTYDKESDRRWHPAISLRLKPLQTLYEMVPVLHGTSGSQGPVVVRGLTKEKGLAYQTSFGGLAPIPAAGHEFVQKNLAPGVDGSRLFMQPPLAGRRICGNVDKPRCHLPELRQLRKWAKAKGLMLS